MVPWLSSKPRTHGPLGSGQINDNTAPVNKASFTPSPRAIYSSLAAGNVTHLCVLLTQLTAAPPWGKLPPPIPSAYRSTLISISIRSQIQSRAPHQCQSQKPGPVIFKTAFQCLSVGLWEWRATARTAFEMPGLVMVDSHMKLPTAPLKRQSPSSSPSSLGPSSSPTGGRGDVRGGVYAKTIQHALKRKAFCVFPVPPTPSGVSKHSQCNKSVRRD